MAPDLECIQSAEEMINERIVFFIDHLFCTLKDDQCKNCFFLFRIWRAKRGRCRNSFTVNAGEDLFFALTP